MSRPDAPAALRALKNFGELPLRFEANAGQTDSEALFLARGHGYILYLTRTEAVLALRAPEPLTERVEENRAHRNRPSQQRLRKHLQRVLRLVLGGANPAPIVTGEEALPGATSYFIGGDPARWRSGVESFARVRYAGVYPGIDLMYYGNQGRLEYDFAVSPGADPARIRFTFEGAQALEPGADGELVVRLADGEIRWQAPVAYQNIDGARREVPCSFEWHGASEIRFALGAYDATQPLIIDPVLSYSTYLGGSDQDIAQAVAVDRLGNVFVTGQTDSINFPTNRAFRGTNAGNAEVFVTKISSNGASLRYSTFLGGNQADVAFGIAVDAGGNACVVGRTASINFPTRNPVQPSLSGINDDAFIVKLGTNGTNLIFSTYFGGALVESAYGVAVDGGTNNLYVVGETSSLDSGSQGARFPLMLPFQSSHGGFTDGFVAKFNATAGTVTYSSYLGGADDDIGRAIAVDATGAAYVCGDVLSCEFCGPSFPVTAGVFQPGYGGLGTDGFVAKINAAGSSKVFASYLGGRGEDLTTGIAVDTNGSIFVVGCTTSTNYPVTSTGFQTAIGDGFGFLNDATLVKIRSNGAAIDYGTFLGGDLIDDATAVALDLAGNAYLAGTTISADFPVTRDAVQTNYGGRDDVFVAMINPNLAGPESLIWSTFLGGPRDESGQGIAVDTNGSVYVCGQTLGTNTFTGSPGVVQPIYGGGNSDAFITKLAAQPTLRWSRSGTNHLAQWIAFPPGFNLVSVTNVNLSNWTAVPGTPAISNGMRRLVVTNVGPRKFLRLRKP